MSGEWQAIIECPFNSRLILMNICFTESDKYRDLSEAIEYPQKSMFEEVQFPPVQTVRAAE